MSKYFTTFLLVISIGMVISADSALIIIKSLAG